MRFWCQFGSIFIPKTLEVLGRLGQVLGRLGGILGRLRMVLESSWAVFGRLVGLLVDILRRLVGVLRRLKKNSLPTAVPLLCTVAGAQGPPIRILYDFPDHYKDIKKRNKD